MFQELDCYDKYRKYWNCSTILKFPELPEINRKLWKETEIPVKNLEILSYTQRPSYTQSLSKTKKLFISASEIVKSLNRWIRNLRTFTDNSVNNGIFIISSTISVIISVKISVKISV